MLSTSICTDSAAPVRSSPEFIECCLVGALEVLE
jgi:hypothetical protein